MMQMWPTHCKNCGQAIQREDKFCVACGAPVDQEPFETDAFHSAAVPHSTAEMHRRVTGFPPRPEITAGAAADPAAQSALFPELAETQQCPRCGKLAPVRDSRCEGCGADLSAASSPATESDNVAALSFAGYADTRARTAARTVSSSSPPEIAVRRRKSRVPVLEILVAILLVGGAATAIRILRSSLPANPGNNTQNVDVTIVPTTANVAAGKALDFAATVSGANNKEISWSLQEGDRAGRVVSRGAKAQDGRVWSLAVYIAPSKPGSYHLLATSEANPKRSAAAAITVAEP